MKTKALSLPRNLDWKAWIERWDRMQERYLVARTERFEVIADLIGAVRPGVTRIIDLGCGTGSVSVHLLNAFPKAGVTGIDLDPTLLPLARARAEDSGRRARFIQRDIRLPDWTRGLARADAVVSATALHWFSARQLQRLYRQLPEVLKPGGIFLNADHVAGSQAGVQKLWEQQREVMRAARNLPESDDWGTFIAAYLAALGQGASELRQKALGQWDGVEPGMPMAWHFDQLRKAGFADIDCFWRLNCDAIYGGILSSRPN